MDLCWKRKYLSILSNRSKWIWNSYSLNLQESWNSFCMHYVNDSMRHWHTETQKDVLILNSERRFRILAMRQSIKWVNVTAVKILVCVNAHWCIRWSCYGFACICRNANRFNCWYCIEYILHLAWEDYMHLTRLTYIESMKPSPLYKNKCMCKWFWFHCIVEYRVCEKGPKHLYY